MYWNKQISYYNQTHHCLQWLKQMHFIYLENNSSLFILSWSPLRNTLRQLNSSKLIIISIQLSSALRASDSYIQIMISFSAFILYIISISVYYGICRDDYVIGSLISTARVKLREIVQLLFNAILYSVDTK